MFGFVASAGATDGTVFFDFEKFPGPDGLLGTIDDIAAPDCSICGPLSNEFSSMGVVFSAGTLAEGNFFPGSARTNHFITSTAPDATFTRLVTGISITSYSFWTATLYALDENNNVIASDTLINPNAGVSLFLGTLNVSADRPIRRFTVLPAGCPIGGSRCDPILNLDNLFLFAPRTSIVPFPPGIPTLSTPGLVALLTSLATTGSLLLRRKRMLRSSPSVRSPA